ncbi:MAG: hypothetical protein AMXMBFR47_35820 [Planctomycetota bacterium]
MVKVMGIVFGTFLLLSVLRMPPRDERGRLTPADRTARAYENAAGTMVVVSVWAAMQLLARKKP